MRRLITGLAGLLSFAALAATTVPPQLISPAGSTSGQAIVSNGPSSAPTWGAVSAGSLSPIAANTLIGNKTGSSAAPTAVAIPSCSTENSALQWTSGTGPACGTTFALTSGNLSQFAATTSAQLSGVLSDETGSGSVVFSASPTFSGNALFAAVSATSGVVNGNLSLNYTSAATQRALNWTNSGTARWFLQNDGSAESGSNAGSNLTLSRFSDAGSFLGNAIVVNRASGAVSIGGTTTNDGAAAGMVGEYITATGSSVPLTNGVAANITSISLTAGDWEVVGSLNFSPAGTTTVSGLNGGISIVSATLPSSPNFTSLSLSYPTGVGQNIPVPSQRVTIGSTTTVYLVAMAGFGVSTMASTGVIRARRVR